MPGYNAASLQMIIRVVQCMKHISFAERGVKIG